MTAYLGREAVAFRRPREPKPRGSAGSSRVHHLTDWVHVTRPAAATGAGTLKGSQGKGGGHPFAELSLGSRGVMNRRTLG